VRSADGAPIAGATVFVLRKARPGGVRDDLPHEVTDEDGRWSLGVRTLADRHVGVIAPGFRHEWLDGEAVVAGEPIDHELERAPPLALTVTDEAGRPVARQGVQLEPWPPRATWYLPGPGARRGEQWKVTDEGGRATFRVGENGPVVMTPHVEGHHAVDGPRWLPHPHGEVEIVVARNRTVEVHVRARKTGEPIADLLTLDLHDPSTGALALSVTDSSSAEGVLRVEGGVRPGTYDLHVHGQGWASVVVPAVRFEAGAEETVGVMLPEAEPRARLRLALRVGGATAPARGRRAPLVYLRRPEPVWTHHGWRQAALDIWQPDAGLIELALAPGRYDVLVADVSSRRAALARDVDLAAGAEIAREVEMRRGVRTSVNPLIAAGGRSRTVAVDAPDWPRLPVYGVTADGRIRVSSDRHVLGRVAEGAGVLVGPYPFDEITVRVIQWDGSVHTHTESR
jgi:hypothetical protein